MPRPRHLRCIIYSMRSGALLLLFFATECLAHPGHGAPAVHLHPTEWLDWLTVAIVLLAAVASGLHLTDRMRRARKAKPRRTRKVS